MGLSGLVKTRLNSTTDNTLTEVTLNIQVNPNPIIPYDVDHDARVAESILVHS